MSLYRRGRTWWIELSSKRGRVRETARTADRKAAWEFHEKRKAEIWREDQLGERPAPTWGEAVSRWLAVKPRGLPDRYRIKALKIQPAERLPLPETALDRVQGSPATFNRALNILIAVHNGVGIDPPEIPRRPSPPGRTRWLTAEEWMRLRAKLEDESPLLRQAAEFTLATGLRENNVLELEWRQVDLRRRVAWLHADQTKPGRSLGVPLNDAACAILAERRGVNRKWVFGNPDRPLTKASNRAWYAAVKKARLGGFRWHDLRHTWASWAVMSGVRMEELQKMGGWATATMVQRYAHLSTEHLAEAAARVKPVSLRYNTPRRGASRTTAPTKGG